MESTNLMALLTKSMISKHEVMFPQTEDEVFSPKRYVFSILIKGSNPPLPEEEILLPLQSIK